MTAYDLASSSPVIFRSVDYRGQQQPLMRDIARATSAGPTYFPPVRQELSGHEATLVDGGLAANNPAMLGHTEAQRNGGSDVLVVSLGTGTKQLSGPGDVTYDAVRSRNWLRVAAGVFTSAMDASSQLQDGMLRQLLDRPGQPRRYWRLQADLGTCNFAMDDASKSNVACLL